MKCISRIPLEPIQMQVFARDANDHFYLITITSRFIIRKVFYIGIELLSRYHYL